MKKAENPARRPYVKPELRRVHLTPEESLSTGCKFASNAGPAGSDCVVTGCFGTGS